MMKIDRTRPRVSIGKNQRQKLNPDRRTGRSKIWTCSLPPIKTCIPDPPCLPICYAHKSYRRYPNGARAAWDKNLAIYQDDPAWFFESITGEIDRAHVPPTLFRWFIGGDLPDPEFLDEIEDLARAFPDISFLMFTKRGEFLPPYGTFPDNLAVLISMFPRWSPAGEYADGYPKAFLWIPDNPDYRIRDSVGLGLIDQVFMCEWNCIDCRRCWNLNPRDVIVFPKHTNGRKPKGAALNEDRHRAAAQKPLSGE